MPARTPSDEFAFQALYRISSNLIAHEGEVALGALFTSMIKGEPWCCAISLESVRAVRDSIAGISYVAIQGVYELVLGRLEEEYGPLYCEDTDDSDDPDSAFSTDVTWGWAGRVGDQLVAPKMKILGADFMPIRSEAFDQGHPDRYRNLWTGTLPTTIWRPLKAASD